MAEFFRETYEVTMSFLALYLACSNTQISKS